MKRVLIYFVARGKNYIQELTIKRKFQNLKNEHRSVHTALNEEIIHYKQTIITYVNSMFTNTN